MSELETQSQRNNIEYAIATGMVLGEIRNLNGTPACVLPGGARVETFPSLRNRPQRIDGTVRLTTVESFIDYYNRFASAHSTIFCDLVQGNFKAVLDYHNSPEKPAWGKHIVAYECPETIEWRAWKANNDKLLPQEHFAHFIEDHLPEIYDPEGAHMLEIAKTLQAKNRVNFRSGIRLDNGQTQFTYEETIESKAGQKGEFKVPEHLKIGLRLFEGGEAYEIDALFRYRINDGRLTMGYHLIRPHKCHEDAVNQICARINDGMKQGMLLHGKV